MVACAIIHTTGVCESRPKNINLKIYLLKMRKKNILKRAVTDSQRYHLQMYM